MKHPVTQPGRRIVHDSRWLALILALTVSGCAAGPDTSDFTAQPTDQAASLVIAATASSAEWRVHVPAAVDQALLETAMQSKRPGDAVVALVVAGQRTQRFDLTPMRGSSVERSSVPRKRKAEAIVKSFEAKVVASVAGRGGLDLLGLLDVAGREAPHAKIISLSSGVSTVAPLDLRQVGWPDGGGAVGSALKATHSLPQYLKDREVAFYYLGDTTGSQPKLTTALRTGLGQAYVTVCRSAGAVCEIRDDPPSGVATSARKRVPVVPLPTVVTLPPTRHCQQTYRVPSVLLFASNSSALNPGATAALRPIAELVSASGGHTVITEVSGHTADVDAGDGVKLSRRRAAAVARALQQLGVESSAIKRVIGRGESQPIARNHKADGTISPSAARNRRVEIFTQTDNCSR